jgi:hypothetical protein
VLTADDRAAAGHLAPVLRRAVALDPHVLARLRLSGKNSTVLVRLPFGVLVSRTVEAEERVEPLDLAVRAAELLAWLEQDVPTPEARDVEWRTGLPPAAGWRRVETVPDSVLRPLVRSGALALKDAAARAGVATEQLRGEVADGLLDSIVLTATDGELTAEVSLRTVSALTRMGFLAKGGQAHVDVVGRWTRLVGEYGTVYLERPGQTLGLL